ncbi:hypothetical protein [Brevibacillus laterosporus]|uniref:hypothetical protein n=1 Tax=Brevibacillus laterosporus TaxID=1465 RepID=UPI0015E256C9|nr:hypothetical protein [Brevibacillus laterosporus]
MQTKMRLPEVFQYGLSLNYKVPDDLAILGQTNQLIGIGLVLSTVDHQLNFNI